MTNEYHHITNRDAALYFRRPAWHGIGDVVEESISPIEAAQRIGVDYTLRKEPLRVDVTPDVTRTVQGKVALVRSDSNEVVSVVGEGYEVYQNLELVNLAHAIGSESGAKIESIFTTDGGAEIAILLQAGSWSVGKDDVTKEYYFLHNRHDGTAPISGRGTGIRTVCRNTVNRALRGRRDFGARHTSNVREVIASAVADIKGIRESIERHQSVADQLAGIAGNVDERLLQRLFAAVQPAQALHLQSPRQEARDRAQRQLAEFRVKLQARIDDPAQQTEAAKGTRWGVFNAITQQIDHFSTVRGEAKDPQRRTRRQILDDTTNQRKLDALDVLLQA